MNAVNTLSPTDGRLSGIRAFGRARRPLIRIVLLLLAPLALLIGGGYYYLTGGRYISTEDAYIQTNMARVNAQISGQVSAVDVADNQKVAAGQVLFRIDPASYQIALNQASAALAAVPDQIQALRAKYKAREAELKSAEETVAFRKTEFTRQRNMLARGATSQQSFDAAQHGLVVAEQQVAVVQGQIAEVLAQLTGKVNAPITSYPLYREALAKRDQAALNLSYTVIRAPAAGIVTRVPKIRPGDFVQAGVPLFSLAETNHVWVRADFKETALTYVRPGQNATITVDTYPGRQWKAKVESISPATGSEFSLLPPQNSSGNWVKVVQRIPVRLDILLPKGGPVLRAGMSVIATIDTHHHYPLPAFLSDILGWFGVGR